MPKHSNIDCAFWNLFHGILKGMLKLEKALADDAKSISHSRVLTAYEANREATSLFAMEFPHLYSLKIEQTEEGHDEDECRFGKPIGARPNSDVIEEAIKELEHINTALITRKPS